MTNPFRSLSEQEKAERDIRSKEVEADIRRLADLGKSLLNDERYKEFKETFEELAQRLINTLIYYEGDDSFIIIRLQERLKVFKSLVGLPTKAIEQQKALRNA